MRFEALEFVEGRQIRIAIIQMHHKADSDEIVFEMIEEGTTTRFAVERPTE